MRSGTSVDRVVLDLNRSRTELRPGTLLTREWESPIAKAIGRRQERVFRAQRPGGKITLSATSAAGRDRTPSV